MIGRVAESASFVLPLALGLVAVVAGRVREGRRRERLNRALHEVRRPLQALLLASPGPAAGGPRELEQVLDAVGELDREVNGRRMPPGGTRIVEARTIALAAASRWRGPAARSGRRLEFRWHPRRAPVRCDPAAIGRALDNLIGNALEHGDGTVRLEGMARSGRLRLFVVDGSPDSRARHRRAAASLRARRSRRDPRRGHGLRIVADVASAHGGRFAAAPRGSGACAVLELPLVEP